MKRTKKTLQVSRETIRQLDASRVAAVNGGNIWRSWLIQYCDGPTILDGKTDGC